ncbi:MAG TPA: hypothetical protein VGF59_23420, partial [Bryobacteraceae bacterium]
LFQVSQGADWIQVNTGDSPVPVSLKPAAASLTPGAYTGIITVTDTQSAANNDPAIVTVTLDVLTTIVPVPATTELTLTTNVAEADVQLTASGNVPFTATSNDRFIALPEPQGTAPGVLHVAISPGSLRPGQYHGEVLLQSPLADDTKAYFNITIIQPTIVTSDPPGLAVTVDGQPMVTPATLVWADHTSHTLSAPPVASGSDPNTRYMFLDWDGTASSTVTVDSRRSPTFTAHFRPSYKLTADSMPADGGSVDASPASADRFYDKGAQVTLTAKPNPGYLFAGWSGDASGVAPQANLLMSSPRSVAAAFSKIPPFKITFASNCTGGKVTVDTVEYATPVTLAFDPGRAYRLGVVSPIPTGTGTRCAYASWSNTSQRDQTFTATADATLSAVYSPEYLVTAAANPQSGGAVTGGGWYALGQSATISASVAAGYVFNGFSGAITGTNNPQSALVNGPLNIAANFVQAQPPQLYATVGAGRADGPQGQRIVTLRMTNASQNAASQVQVNSITGIIVLGGSGAVTIATPLPIAFGDLTSGGFQDAQLMFNWPATATRVRFTVNFSANSGAYQGSNTLTLFR